MYTFKDSKTTSLWTVQRLFQKTFCMLRSWISPLFFVSKKKKKRLIYWLNLHFQEFSLNPRKTYRLHGINISVFLQPYPSIYFLLCLRFWWRVNSYVKRMTQVVPRMNWSTGRKEELVSHKSSCTCKTKRYFFKQALKLYPFTTSNTLL